MALHLGVGAPIKPVGGEIVEIRGSFFPNGSNAPTKVGSGFSVSRTDTGTFLVTFDEVLRNARGWQFSMRNEVATICSVQGGDYVAASRTVTIRTFESGSISDFDADADCEVSFSVWSEESGAAVS